MFPRCSKPYFLHYDTYGPDEIDTLWVQSLKDPRFYMYGEAIKNNRKTNGDRFLAAGAYYGYYEPERVFNCPNIGITTVFQQNPFVLGCNASDFTDTKSFKEGKLAALKEFGWIGQYSEDGVTKTFNKETPQNDITVEQAWARITDEVMTNREFAVAWERELEFIYGAVFAAKDLTEAQKVPMAMRYLFPEYMPAHKGLYYYLKGGMAPVAKAANKET